MNEYTETIKKMKNEIDDLKSKITELRTEVESLQVIIESQTEEKEYYKSKADQYLKMPFKQSLNEIKAQAIEEMLSKQKQRNIEFIQMGGVSDPRKCLPFGLMREYANIIRGEK